MKSLKARTLKKKKKRGPRTYPRSTPGVGRQGETSKGE